MNIRLYPRLNKPNRDGTVTLYFEYQRRPISTGERINPKAWDQKTRSLNARYAGTDLIQIRLAKKKTALIEIIEGNPEKNLDVIVSQFSSYLDSPDKLRDIISNKPSTEFTKLVDEVLHANRNKWSENYKIAFRSLRSKILQHDANFRIEDLNAQWWNDFIDFCITELGNNNNTISVNTRTLSALVNEIRRLGHFVHSSVDDVGFKYIEPETKGLSWEVVKKIAYMELSNKRYHETRVLWCIAAFTGRRWNEIANLSAANFYRDNNNRWRYRAIGKGMKKVDIPLLPEAVEFLQFINFKFPAMKNPRANTEIKEIARLAGLTSMVPVRSIVGKDVTDELVEECETVHFHTSRHTYALHLVDISSGYPNREKWVSNMLGHSSFAVTWKYISIRESAFDQMFDQITSGKTPGTSQNQTHESGTASQSDKPGADQL